MCTQLASVCRGRSTSCFVYGFVFQVTLKKILYRMHSKGFARNLREFLYGNNCNYNSCKCSYKFTLSLFCPFVETKNKNQIFSKLIICQQEIFLFFVHSKSHSTSKVCRIQWTFTKGSSCMLLLLELQFYWRRKYTTKNQPCS